MHKTRKQMRGKGCLIAAAAFLSACGSVVRMNSIKEEGLGAGVSIPAARESRFEEITAGCARRDTLTVKDEDGTEMLIMRAVRDENGEMVARDVIDAAVVVARFRNVAERHGRVDLEFEIRVPSKMMDPKWQIRLDPQMYILSDTVSLDAVLLTGRDYRRSQLRGYQRYEKFLESIISDTTVFIRKGQLERFLQRNLPEVFAFKADSSLVSEEEFRDAFGTTEKEAVEHYTDKFALSRNHRRLTRSPEMYRRYVKAPIEEDGIRLDSVFDAASGDFVYSYVQSIKTRPGLRKVDVCVQGQIFEQGQRIYEMPPSEKVSFYISSISTLTDPTERKLTRVVERLTEANTACYIDFSSGKSAVDESLGHNREEIGRIKENLRELLTNEKFQLDSITISAFASPEGKLSYNAALSLERARSASRYFSSYLRFLSDSLTGYHIDAETGVTTRAEDPAEKISFASHSGGENWRMLDVLVENSENLSEAEKDAYRESASVKDPDARERALSKKPFYKVLREEFYPRLRVVKFDFYLHRKGMLKDTVHTTVTDSLYMSGVQALRDRDYEAAVKILGPYADYNTAVAYVALDRNSSARAILDRLPSSPAVLYMKAIVCSRTGDVQDAVECYLQACRMDESFVHRGNLDPEISALIREYGLTALREDF